MKKFLMGEKVYYEINDIQTNVFYEIMVIYEPIFFVFRLSAPCHIMTIKKSYINC